MWIARSTRRQTDDERGHTAGLTGYKGARNTVWDMNSDNVTCARVQFRESHMNNKLAILGVGMEAGNMMVCTEGRNENNGDGTQV